MDAWSYYRNQFLNLGNNVRMACGRCSAELRCRACNTGKTAGMKGCDLVAWHASTTWLIEVKDYRQNQRTKAIDVADEVALKVRDSLAVLLGAKTNADDEEKTLAAGAIASSDLRVVLHLEQPVKPSKLFPRAINPANVSQRLRQLVRAIDPHPVVAETTEMNNLPWTVS
jgi:hypothetical protein